MKERRLAAEHPELIDRDVLYSILDKDTKRAQAYWFLSVNVLSEPYTANYELETFDTDCVFRVRLNLGFKRSQRINIYLRQIARIKAIPFIVTSAPVPNRETMEAIEEGERIAHDPTVPGYKDMDSLRKALNS